MTDETLRDALERIADRAQPTDDLAERVLRRVARRRRAQMAAGAAGVVAAIAVPTVAVQTRPAEAPPAATRVQQGSAEEREVAAACLREETPEDRTEGARSGLGEPDDVRLLARVRLKRGYVAAVGSERGFVLCSAVAGGQNVEEPNVHQWPSTTGKGGLWSFNTALRVDAIVHLAEAADAATTSPFGMHFVTMGRVKPQIKRVKVTWNKRRSADAAVQRGFFLAQYASGSDPVDGPGPLSEDASSTDDDAVVAVTGYDDDGRVQQTWRPSGDEGGRFTPDDCADGPGPRHPALCEG
ncbi:hypothetical protein [Actinomadura xylanilytica]|uniref:hypothetical protein n=1 Tax=Actinomadura xylanilytica TaxID=887459 RepID=UPI00255AE8AA|nr:hypothetical protein [Actinomadura xylanilytica]MDL4775959.1 hypothetical protein [Actinomadura xylanilytica]